MTLDDQHLSCVRFFQSCMKIFMDRGVEYAPERVPLVDVFYAAVEENVSILAVLRILTQKHLTAIRHFEQHGYAAGPTIHERFRDVANFQALQSFYVSHQTELHNAWASHLVQSSRCACVVERPHDTLNPLMMRVQRCVYHLWLDAHPPSIKGSPPASAHLG